LTLRTGTGLWRMMVIVGLGILPLEVQGMDGVVIVAGESIGNKQADQKLPKTMSPYMSSCTSTSRCKVLARAGAPFGWIYIQAPRQACPLNSGLLQKRHAGSRT
jgi:hypothetical protein